MLLTHSSDRLSCLITPSVQKLETTAQTPLGKRLILKHTVRAFLIHTLRVLITEFTFHPRIPSPSLGIGRASVMGLRVDTGSDRRANRETQNRNALTAHYRITADFMFTWAEQYTSTSCINLPGPRRSFRDTPEILEMNRRGHVCLCGLILVHYYKENVFESAFAFQNSGTEIKEAAVIKLAWAHIRSLNIAVQIKNQKTLTIWGGCATMSSWDNLRNHYTNV